MRVLEKPESLDVLMIQEKGKLGHFDYTTQKAEIISRLSLAVTNDGEQPDTKRLTLYMDNRYIIELEGSLEEINAELAEIKEIAERSPTDKTFLDMSEIEGSIGPWVVDPKDVLDVGAMGLTGGLSGPPSYCWLQMQDTLFGKPCERMMRFTRTSNAFEHKAYGGPQFANRVREKLKEAGWSATKLGHNAELSAEVAEENTAELR